MYSVGTSSVITQHSVFYISQFFFIDIYLSISSQRLKPNNYNKNKTYKTIPKYIKINHTEEVTQRLHKTLSAKAHPTLSWVGVATIYRYICQIYRYVNIDITQDISIFQVLYRKTKQGFRVISDKQGPWQIFILCGDNVRGFNAGGEGKGLQRNRQEIWHY